MTARYSFAEGHVEAPILKPLGFQKITDLSAAVGLTVPAGAARAVLQCETQNVRWRDDTTNPTATVGMLMRSTEAPFVYDGALSDIKFIEVASGAVLNVTYYSKRQGTP